MNKKILILVFGMLVLLATPLVASADWDNSLDYEDNDMTLKLSNWFGLGEEFGKFKLASHKEVGEIRKIIEGENRVTMYYETKGWKEVYKNGLGEVTFINMLTGEEIEKEYEFVIATYKQVPTYKEECNPFYTDVNMSNSVPQEKERCSMVVNGTHTEKAFDKWEIYNSKDIPKEDVTIGIMVEVKHGETIDAIWTIAGKKAKKHAIWTATLNVGLPDYWNFDEPSGVLIEQVSGINNGTNTGADYGATGIINDAYDFVAANNDHVDIADSPDFDVAAFTISMWVNPDATLNYIIIDRSAATTGPGFFIGTRISGKIFFGTNTGDGWIQPESNAALSTGSFNHVVAVYNGVNSSIYIDGVMQADSRADTGTITSAHAWRFGAWSDDSEDFDGVIDEVGFWNRSLSDAEVTQLYNGGSGITHTTDFGTVINIITPTNATLNTPPIELNYTASDEAASCMFSDDLGLTNSSQVVCGTNFSSLISLVGDNTWTVYANNTLGDLTSSSVAFFFNASVGTTLSEPADKSNFTFTNLNFSWNSSAGNVELVNTTLLIYNASNNLIFENLTSLSGTSAISSFNVTLPEGVFNWSATTEGTFDTINTSENRTVTIHITPVTLDIITPDGEIDFIKIGDNLTLNWTVEESGQNLSDHIKNCSYLYNEVETEISLTDCINTNFTSFLYVQGVENVTLLVEEEFGLTTTATNFFNFKVIETSQTFNNVTIEGNVETLKINITINSSNTISTGNLIYNGTSFSGSIDATYTPNIIISRELEIEDVTSQINNSFFWEINLVDGSNINSSVNNQTVEALEIDDCNTQPFLILNYTIRDEGTQDFLVGATENTTGEIDVNVFPIDSTNQILEFSQNYSKINPMQVCVNLDLNNSMYRMDVITRYKADGKVNEFNNIQNFSLSNNSIPQNINLFDLASADSTEFLMNFKDDSFLTVDDALLTITRFYISEGVFKTVEAPKTDSNGQTVAHLVRSDVIYTIIVSKDGVILGTFDNVVAVCQDFSILDCAINLNAFSTGLAPTDFQTIDNLRFTLTLNQDTRLLESIFTTLDGSVATVLLNATKFDSLGNESVCSQQVTSSAGTLQCTVPESFGNLTVIAQIFKDGDFKGYSALTIEESPVDIFGYTGVFFTFIIALSFVMLFISSKRGMIFGFIFGLITSSLLGLWSSGTILGLGSAIVWVIVAGSVLIWKISKDEGE